MTLTAEQTAQAKALGFDPSSWDWAKIAQVIQFILALLAQQKAQATAATKAKVGCDDQHAELMHEAICLNLQAADKCVQCCCQ